MLPLVAFDWSGKAVHVTHDGEAVQVLRSEFDLLDILDEPHRIVCESSVESYNPAKYLAFLERSARAGHELRVVSPRLTKWYRERNGVAKSDANDARAIYALALQPKQHLKVPGPRLDKDTDEWAKRRAKAEHRLMVLRATGEKDGYARRVARTLPKFDTLDDWLRRALGGKTYSSAILAACSVAVEYTKNRDEWERLLGLSAHGKNSQFRSDIFHHGWAGGRTTPRKPLRVKKTGELKLDKGGNQLYHGKLNGDRRRDDLTLTEYRRALRWLHRQLRDAPHLDGMVHPASAGIMDPRGGAHA